jgi:hypothetical protein
MPENARQIMGLQKMNPMNSLRTPPISPRQEAWLSLKWIQWRIKTTLSTPPPRLFSFSLLINSLSNFVMFITIELFEPKMGVTK